MVKKILYKSKRYKVIDGVCGGIAEYFNTDPTLIRLLWVILVFFWGFGIIVYIIAMIIMPEKPVKKNSKLRKKTKK